MPASLSLTATVASSLPLQGTSETIDHGVPATHLVAGGHAFTSVLNALIDGAVAATAASLAPAAQAAVPATVTITPTIVPPATAEPATTTHGLPKAVATVVTGDIKGADIPDPAPTPPAAGTATPDGNMPPIKVGIRLAGKPVLSARWHTPPASPGTGSQSGNLHLMDFPASAPPATDPGAVPPLWPGTTSTTDTADGISPLPTANRTIVASVSVLRDGTAAGAVTDVSAPTKVATADVTKIGQSTAVPATSDKPETTTAKPKGAPPVTTTVAASADDDVTTDRRTGVSDPTPDPAIIAPAQPAGHRADQTPVALSISTPGSPTARPEGQVAVAVMRLLDSNAGHRVTISLSPHELGQVDISIERHATGVATVTIAIERPETLDLLRHDKPQLQAALNRAGLSVAPDAVTLHLRPPPAAAVPSGHAAHQVPDRASMDSASPGSQSASNGDRPQGQQQGQGRRREGTSGWLAGADILTSAVPFDADVFVRDGIDITA